MIFKSLPTCPVALITMLLYVCVGDPMIQLYKKETATVQFTCEVETNDKDVLWMKDGTVFKTRNGLVISDVRIHFWIELGMEIIEIRELRKSDKGIYVCIARTSDSQKAMKKYNLTIIEPVKLENYTRSVSVLEGETARLWCNATSVPPPDIEWYLDTPKGRLKAGIKGPMLGVNDVRRSCINSFVCEAVNPEDPDRNTVEGKLKIIAKFEPEVKIEISKRKAGTRTYVRTQPKVVDDNNFEIKLQGSPTIRLKCEVEASPYNMSTWFVNNQTAAAYTNQGRVEINTEHRLRAKMEFYGESLSVSKHIFVLQISIIDGNEFGMYTCRSNNEYGVTEKSIKISEK